MAIFIVRNDIKLRRLKRYLATHGVVTPKSKRRGERVMDRKLLEELGLEDEQVEKIMASHGKAIGDTKKALETVTTEKKGLEKKVEDLSSTLTTTNKKYEDYDKKLNGAAKELENSKLQNSKFRIANEKGIPLELAGRLSGETEEEILDDAEKLSSFVSQKQTLPLGSTEPQPKKEKPYSNQARIVEEQLKQE